MKLFLAFAGGAAVAVLAFLAISPGRQSAPAPLPPAPPAVGQPIATPASTPEVATPSESAPAPPQPMPARKPVKIKPTPAAEPAETEPAPPPVVAKAEPVPPPREQAQEEPAPAPPVDKKSEPERPHVLKPDAVEQKRAKEERTPQTVTVPEGTVINARLNQPLSSDRNENGDSFSATLVEPLVVNGFVIAERGARVDGQVVDAVRAGKVKGVAKLSVRLITIHTSDHQRVAVLTDAFVREGGTSRGSDAAKMGAGAGIGAALGAIFGGGKGAAIGAAAGGAAGGGTVLLTRGRPAEFDVETRIPFRLREPVTITENLR